MHRVDAMHGAQRSKPRSTGACLEWLEASRVIASGAGTMPVK